jgi:L-amino acid N-acyltransferase YncA
MPLPAGTACLEDSVTAVHCRGRGLAPAVWARVADSLAGQGFAALITKVAEDNLPSRRAVEKAGFEPVARMELIHVWPVTHVVIQPHGDPQGVAYLRAALAR